MNPSDSAYPYTVNFDELPRETTVETGLTKREYFAAMAMQGLISGYVASREQFTVPDDEAIARNAVELSDALIDALNKTD